MFSTSEGQGVNQMWGEGYHKTDNITAIDRHEIC